MSRKIDTSNPKSLSVEDRKYLQDRGRLPAGLKPVTDADLANAGNLIDETESTGDVGGSQPDSDLVSTDDEGGEEVAYEDMDKDDLKAECQERGLPVSGNKQDLIDRLIEDDESEGDEE